MKRLILAIILVIYAQKSFCFDIEWNKVELAFPKVENQNLNEFIYSIWKQDKSYAPEELDVYNIYCSLSGITVFLYTEPIGTSHFIGYYIMQDSSGYHDLSLIEILEHILINNNKHIKSKLMFLKELIAIVDSSSLISINNFESSYLYSRHGMASLLSKKIVNYNSLRLDGTHYSDIDKWIYYNYGRRCDYNLKNLFSSRNNDIKIIKVSYESKDDFCMYSIINSNVYFYKIEKGLIDTILLNLADKVINQSRMSDRQKVILIRSSLEAMIYLYRTIPEF